MEYRTSRRSVLAGGLVAVAAWVGRPLLRPLYGRQSTAAITAVQVDSAPTDPEDGRWNQAGVAMVALRAQDLVLPRLQEAGTAELGVRAMYDADRLSILVEWKDAHKDSELGTVMQYRDAVAVMFPEDPALGSTSVMMGIKGRGVTVYHWKSDWQFGRDYDVDEAYPNMYSDWYQGSGVPAGEIAEATDYLASGQPEFLTAAAVGNSLADPTVQERTGPVEKMRAEGFGTVEPDETQDAKGSGVWKEGVWRIAISMPRRQGKFTFEEGTINQVAVAVWDGSRAERNGQKAFSDWQETTLASSFVQIVPPATATAPVPGTADGDGGGSVLPLVGGVGGAVIAAVAAVIGLRLRRRKSKQEEQ